MDQQGADPDLEKSIEVLAGEIFDDPQAWLDAPHPMFGGQSPRELAQTEQAGERVVWSLLKGLKHGFSP